MKLSSMLLYQASGSKSLLLFLTLLPSCLHRKASSFCVILKPEGNRVWAPAACHHLAKKQRQGLDYNCTFISIRGQHSKKVAGKNPHVHLILSFQKRVYFGETWEFGRGKFLMGHRCALSFGRRS